MKICKTLDYLKKAVMEEYLPQSQKKGSNNKMKIKMSKVQWEKIGRMAGWMQKRAQQVIKEWENNGTKYYEIDDLTLEGVPDTQRYSDLARGEEHRVIGGDKGDLLFSGYSVDEENQVTHVYKPVLRTSFDLNSDQAVEIAFEILMESFSSVGWETLYHS